MLDTESLPSFFHGLRAHQEGAYTHPVLFSTNITVFVTTGHYEGATNEAGKKGYLARVRSGSISCGVCLCPRFERPEGGNINYRYSSSGY